MNLSAVPYTLSTPGHENLYGVRMLAMSERAFEARRAFLETGSYAEAGKRLGVSKGRAYQLVCRANQVHPLVVPGVTVKGFEDASPDAKAVRAYVRLALDRAGIQK